MRKMCDSQTQKGAMNTDGQKQIGSNVLLSSEKEYWEITVTENIKSREQQEATLGEEQEAKQNSVHAG